MGLNRARFITVILWVSVDRSAIIKSKSTGIQKTHRHKSTSRSNFPKRKPRIHAAVVDVIENIHSLVESYTIRSFTPQGRRERGKEGQFAKVSASKGSHN